jgi:N-methylhydantoinase A
MEAQARSDLTGPSLRRRADLRYRGQSFELTVEADDLGELPAHFHATHERRYGFRMDGEPVELTSVRLVATVAGARPQLTETLGHPADETGCRRANFDGNWTAVSVLDRTCMGSGSKVEGPTIVEFPEATCVVRPEWRGSVDEVGTLVLERL